MLTSVRSRVPMAPLKASWVAGLVMMADGTQCNDAKGPSKQTSSLFQGEIAALQQRAAQCKAGLERQSAAIDVMNVRVGQRILDVGCGGGYFAKELSQAVGDTGLMTALDPSPTQLDAAKKTCAGLKNVEFIQGDATSMPFDDESFHSVTTIQTLEYIKDVDAAIQEIRRVLKPGGRLAAISTMWSLNKIYGIDEELEARVNQGKTAIADLHENLPVDMPSKLKAAGFVGVQQVPLPTWDTTYHENSFGYLWTRIKRAQLKKSGALSEDELQQWDNVLETAVKEDRFAFARIAVLTFATVP